MLVLRACTEVGVWSGALLSLITLLVFARQDPDIVDDKKLSS